MQKKNKANYKEYKADTTDTPCQLPTQSAQALHRRFSAFLRFSTPALAAAPRLIALEAAVGNVLATLEPAVPRGAGVTRVFSDVSGSNGDVNPSVFEADCCNGWVCVTGKPPFTDGKAVDIGCSAPEVTETTLLAGEVADEVDNFAATSENSGGGT
jgi:hypothetical protein